jgi:hypothetical protein
MMSAGYSHLHFLLSLSGRDDAAWSGRKYQRSIPRPWLATMACRVSIDFCVTASCGKISARHPTRSAIFSDAAMHAALPLRVQKPKRLEHPHVRCHRVQTLAASASTGK